MTSLQTDAFRRLGEKNIRNVAFVSKVGAIFKDSELCCQQTALFLHLSIWKKKNFKRFLSILLSASSQVIFSVTRFRDWCIRVGQKIPKLMPTKSSEMVSSYDYLSQKNCISQHLVVTAFYSKALLSYVVINSSCM